MPKSQYAQFAPGPQDSNTSAIHKNNTQFSFWSNDVIINRGWQNIADTTSGKTTVGTNLNANGKSNNLIVSLGDGGEAILNFPFPIYNVNGFDFAVFENGFAQNESEENFYFLEFAKVEVSEDGVNFIPFESTSTIDNNNQKLSFETTNCTYVNNLAGKYPLNYGTPFDLEELGVDSILSVKIIDVVGSIDTNFASFDSQSNIINDPYPTDFPSGGFDLNAIGALNQPNVDTTLNDTLNTKIPTIELQNLSVYPNPVQQHSLFNVETENDNSLIQIYSAIGKMMFESNFSYQISIETKNIEKGIYFIKIDGYTVKKIMIN